MSTYAIKGVVTAYIHQQWCSRVHLWNGLGTRLCTDLVIFSSESAMIGTHKVSPLHLWYRLNVLLPLIGEDVGYSLLVQPLHLFSAGREGGREGERERGREGEREGGREGGREGLNYTLKQ